jgi:hypothetical protein
MDLEIAQNDTHQKDQKRLKYQLGIIKTEIKNNIQRIQAIEKIR